MKLGLNSKSKGSSKRSVSELWDWVLNYMTLLLNSKANLKAD